MLVCCLDLSAVGDVARCVVLGVFVGIVEFFRRSHCSFHRFLIGKIVKTVLRVNFFVHTAGCTETMQTAVGERGLR